MLKHTGHLTGVAESGEILFETPFGYIFDFLCHQDEHLLPPSDSTIRGLLHLGDIMADPGNPEMETKSLDSTIPAIYTYLGQFIDHDITARTDRNTAVSTISGPGGNELNIIPTPPCEVTAHLKNGRRPQLDLDSIFGDGPPFATKYFFESESYKYQTEAAGLYNLSSLRLNLEQEADYLDVYRKEGKAILGDARNDENLMISQLHAAFIAAYNKLMQHLATNNPKNHEREYRHSIARKLLRWAYQYIVINDYLPQVCDPAIVTDTLCNGPYYYLPKGEIFMPLEFSVAAFRFGHSMIRPFYKINDLEENEAVEISRLLGVQRNLLKEGMLDKDKVVAWSHFVGPCAQRARKIDWRIVRGLFQLNVIDKSIPAHSMMAMLTKRNLLRGYSLSIPTGQAISKAMRIFPLSEDEILSGIEGESRWLLKHTGIANATPLWFYLLKEAEIHNNGERLGAVGSKIVAETLVGLVKYDNNSYLNQQHPRITRKGIKIEPNTTISTIEDLLRYAEVSF